MIPDLRSNWVEIGARHELRTTDGGVFAHVRSTGDGAFSWTLSSPSFATPLGPAGGTCRQLRHAKRTVERIREAGVRASRKKIDMSRFQAVDTIVDGVCRSLGAALHRTIVMGPTAYDITYTAMQPGSEPVTVHQIRIGSSTTLIETPEPSTLTSALRDVMADNHRSMAAT